MKLKLLTIAALIAGTASMAETRLTTSGMALDIDNGGDVEALRFNVEGNQSDFDYEMTAIDGEVGNIQVQSFDAKVGWTGFPVGQIGVGPALAYEGSELANFGWEDTTSVGGMIRGEFNNLTLSADLLSDVDDFDDNWQTTLEADYRFSPDFEGFGDYSYHDFNETHEVDLGVRYNVVSNMFVEVAGLYANDNVIGDAFGARLGLGARF